MNKNIRNIRPRPFSIRFTIATVVLATGMAPAFAQTTNVIALTNSDVLGASSFNSAGNWSSGVAPVSGLPGAVNAYYTTNFTLRTPAGGNNYIFGGDLLSIDPSSTNAITGVATNIGTGTLSIKGYGLITVSNLILNGGTILNNGTGGNPNTAQLAGNITVTSNATVVASTLDGGNTNTATLNILAPMSGPGGINVLDYGTVLLSASNSFSGQVTVGNGTTENGYLRVNNTNAIPAGVNLRVNFVTTSNNPAAASVFDLGGFNVTVNELITGNSNAIVPEIINSAPASTNVLTVGYGNTGQSYTYRGFIRDNLGTGGSLALVVDGLAVTDDQAAGNSSFTWDVPPGGATYSGDTTINGGILSLGPSGNTLPWGAGKGNIIVNSGGVLNLGGRSPQINGLSGNGLIDDLSAGRSTLGCGSNDVSSVFSGIIENSVYADVQGNGIIQISKFGAGTLTLSGTNTYYGNVTVNNGILQITCQFGDGLTGGGLGVDGYNASTTGSKEVSIKGGSGLYLNATNGSPIVIDANTLFLTAGVIANEFGNNTINGQIWLQSGGGATNRVDGGFLTLAGPISITNQPSRTLTLSGAGNGLISGVIADYDGTELTTSNLTLAMSGTGTWTLNNNNIYSGATIINSGTLALTGSGAIATSTNITIAGGATFDVSGLSSPFALDASQILGNRSSTALITGSVNASSGTLSLTYASGAPSLSVANGTFTLASGTPVTINNTGAALSAGVYELISPGAGGNVAGTAPASVKVTGSGLLPGATASLEISGGQLDLLISGGTPMQPQITAVHYAGTSLVISGTNGLSGEQYNVLTTTNLSLPLSDWTVGPTDTFSGNNFSVTNTVNAGLPHEFYLIRVP